MSKRGNEPVSLPDAIIAYRLGDLNNHPDYPEAKAGDFEAAFRIADSMATTRLRKVKRGRLPVSIRLSKSEYESLMNEMWEAAKQIRKKLKAA